MKIMSPPDWPDHQATNISSSSRLDDKIVEISAPSQKQKYTKADLPFPCGGNYHQIWAKHFRVALLSWAGSQDCQDLLLVQDRQWVTTWYLR